MNVMLGEDMNTIARVDSPVTAGSDSEDSENPLMKLVDAAASLCDTKKGQMKDKSKENVQSLNVDDDTVSPRSSMDLEKVESKETPSVVISISKDEENVSKETESRNSSPSPIQSKEEDSGVIIGTKEDLVRRAEKKASFAEYLMNVLDDEANHDTISWMPEGDCFTILNHRKFTMDRMPKLFKIRNMSSFVRKLTRWGFHRVHEKETGNSDIFRHEYFIQGKPELAKKIRCLNRAAEAAAVAAAASYPNTKSGKTKGVNKSVNSSVNQKEGTLKKGNANQQHPAVSDNHSMVPPSSSPLKTMRSVNLHDKSLNAQDISRQESQQHSPFASSEHEHLLVRQEQMRRQALVRQEDELQRQQHDILQQQHQLNRVSPDYRKGLFSRGNEQALQRNVNGLSSFYPDQPRMSPEEISRQQHQLQQQQRRLQQQQRALELARLQHEQEQHQHHPPMTQGFNNRRPFPPLLDYEIEMEMDLMNTSNRSFDFLGTSGRSLDLLSTSTRSLDLLSNSGRSFGGQSLVSDNTPASSILRGGPPTSPTHHHHHQQQRDRILQHNVVRQFPMSPERGNKLQQSNSHNRNIANTGGPTQNNASSPVQELFSNSSSKVPISSLQRDDNYIGASLNGSQRTDSNRHQMQSSGLNSSYIPTREEMIRTMLRQKQEEQGHRQSSDLGHFKNQMNAHISNQRSHQLLSSNSNRDRVNDYGVTRGVVEQQFLGRGSGHGLPGVNNWTNNPSPSAQAPGRVRFSAENGSNRFLN